MKVAAIYILCSGMMALVASSPITTRGTDQLYDRRGPNEIHVGGRQEQKKVCEVSVRRHRGYNATVCTSDKSMKLGPGGTNIGHSCEQEYYAHNGISVPSGCALYLETEVKHAEEKQNTRECVCGEGSGSLGIHEVFFVQEITISEVTVNAGCSTYYKD